MESNATGKIGMQASICQQPGQFHLQRLLQHGSLMRIEGDAVQYQAVDMQIDVHTLPLTISIVRNSASLMGLSSLRNSVRTACMTYHRDVFITLRSQKSRIQGDAVDIAAGEVELCQAVEIQITVVSFRVEDQAGKCALPYLLALGHAGKGEVDDKTQPPQECLIQRAFHIGRQDCQASEGFHALQQICHLGVGKAVVAVLDFAAFAEQRIGFVKKQQRAPSSAASNTLRRFFPSRRYIC